VRRTFGLPLLAAESESAMNGFAQLTWFAIRSWTDMGRILTAVMVATVACCGDSPAAPQVAAAGRLETSSLTQPSPMRATPEPARPEPPPPKQAQWSIASFKRDNLIDCTVATVSATRDAAAPDVVSVSKEQAAAMVIDDARVLPVSVRAPGEGACVYLPT
jgi:hypothetical protein